MRWASRVDGACEETGFQCYLRLYTVAMPFAPRIQQLSLVLLVTVLFLLPLPLAAQVFDLSLSANKSTFNARDRVVITAESNSVDLETADIEWVVNNTPLSRGVGLTSQPIVLGVVGESTEVTVSVYEDEDVLLTTSTLTIAPATVSIHWESNGYTNPFYRGRALATPGTEVTVEARAFLLMEMEMYTHHNSCTTHGVAIIVSISAFLDSELHT